MKGVGGALPFSINYFIMHIIQFPYNSPTYSEIKKGQSEQFAIPSADFIAEWRRFERNIHSEFPSSDLSWRFWQFELACLNQSLSIRDLECTDMKDKLSQLMIPTNYFDSVGFIATFHFASYRLLGKWLALRGIPFLLVVSGKVKSEQEMLFYRSIEACLQKPADFGVLDANDPRILFKIKRGIDSGYMILIYVDGNISASDKRLTEVRLLEHDISVQSGIGFMANWLKVPVYPILSVRDRDNVGFVLHDPLLVTSDFVNGEDRVTVLVKKLYSFLSNLLQDEPGMWENWFYLDEFLLHNDARVSCK